MICESFDGDEQIPISIRLHNIGSGASVAVGDASNPGAALISNVTLTGGRLSGHGGITGNVTNTSGTVTNVAFDINPHTIRIDIVR